jgi:diguanylate cyclase (GGDEF)-like protein
VPAQRVLAAQHALLAGAEGVLSTADDRFRDMLVASVALLTLCGTLAVGLAARRSRRWTGLFVVPVRQLLDSVQAVARGQFKVHAVDDGLAEIVELSDGLADMATSLRLQQRALATRAEQADRSAERLRRVLGFARDVSASLTLPYVLDAIGNAARALTGTGRARLWLLDDEQGQLTLAHDTGGDSPPGAPVTVLLGAGAVGRATRFGQVSHAQHADEAGPAGAVGRHTVAVPLVASGRAIGALEIGWDSEDKLDDEILEVLEAVAGHGAVAIEAARSYERTENLSLSDPLTGLANRRRLEQDLSLETQRAGRYGRSLAFLMIDVDHFKRVNDVHGHVVGDRVLQQLANLLSEEARSVDSVYRYGGEELAVIARETDLLGAGRLAERLRRVVEHTFRGAATPVTISIGVATMPEQAATVEELLHAADEALYRAKREGRNRVVLAEGLSDPSLPELPQVPMGL